MPVVRESDHDSVEIFFFQHAAKVFMTFRGLARELCDIAPGAFERLRVDIAKMCDLAAVHTGETRSKRASARVDADDAYANFIISSDNRTRCGRRCGE